MVTDKEGPRVLGIAKTATMKLLFVCILVATGVEAKRNFSVGYARFCDSLLASGGKDYGIKCKDHEPDPNFKPHPRKKTENRPNPVARVPTDKDKAMRRKGMIKVSDEAIKVLETTGSSPSNKSHRARNGRSARTYTKSNAGVGNNIVQGSESAYNSKRHGRGANSMKNASQGSGSNLSDKTAVSTPQKPRGYQSPKKSVQKHSNAGTKPSKSYLQRNHQVKKSAVNTALQAKAGHKPDGLSQHQKRAGAKSLGASSRKPTSGRQTRRSHGRSSNMHGKSSSRSIKTGRMHKRGGKQSNAGNKVNSRRAEKAKSSPPYLATSSPSTPSTMKYYSYAYPGSSDSAVGTKKHLSDMEITVSFVIGKQPITQ